MQGEERGANSLHAATTCLDIGAYEMVTKRRGENMTTQSMRAADSQTGNDILLASTFGLWAVLLGVMPVLAIYSFS
jgi:hypothetical protein